MFPVLVSESSSVITLSLSLALPLAVSTLQQRPVQFGDRRHRYEIGVPTPKSPLSVGWPGPVSNYSVIWDHMSVPAKWHLIPSNDFSRVHECDRRHTAGQTTDRPRTVTSVAIDRIDVSDAASYAHSVFENTRISQRIHVSIRAGLEPWNMYS